MTKNIKGTKDGTQLTCLLKAGVGRGGDCPPRFPLHAMGPFHHRGPAEATSVKIKAGRICCQQTDTLRNNKTFLRTKPMMTSRSQEQQKRARDSDKANTEANLKLLERVEGVTMSWVLQHPWE